MVNVSLTMAHDSLLQERLLQEPENPEEGNYAGIIGHYLNVYKKNFGFDAVFLISASTSRYYSFNGVDRMLTQEDHWYAGLLEADKEYCLNMDSDRVSGADGTATVFVNCKIRDGNGAVTGVVGVGLRLNDLADILQEYEDEFDVKASLIDEAGLIKFSADNREYKRKDWFETYEFGSIREKVLGWKKDDANLGIWVYRAPDNGQKTYVVTRYLPKMGWHLIVEQDTGQSLLRIVW